MCVFKNKKISPFPVRKITDFKNKKNTLTVTEKLSFCKTEKVPVLRGKTFRKKLLTSRKSCGIIKANQRKTLARQKIAY